MKGPNPLGPNSYMHHYIGPTLIYLKKIMAVLEFEEQRNHVLKEKNCEISSKALENFLYALKAAETKRQYPKRLIAFFDFSFPLYHYRNNLIFIQKRLKI